MASEVKEPAVYQEGVTIQSSNRYKVQAQPLGGRHELARWMGRASRTDSLEEGNGDSNGSCIPGGGGLRIKGMDVTPGIGACRKGSCCCWNAVSGVEVEGERRERAGGGGGGLVCRQQWGPVPLALPR